MTPVLESLGWLKMNNLVEMRDLVQLYKLLNFNDAPSELSGRVTRRSEVSLRSTRGVLRGDLQVPKYATTLAGRSFYSRAPREWNLLPATVTGATSLSSFKKAVRGHMTGEGGG